MTRPAIHLRGHEVEVFGAVLAKVGAFGEVLPEKTVGVLVGAALPWASGVAEVNLEAGRHLDLQVIPHFLSLVPGQRLPDEVRQLLGGVDNGLLDQGGTVAVGEMKEHHEASRAFDQCAYGRLPGVQVWLDPPPRPAAG